MKQKIITNMDKTWRVLATGAGFTLSLMLAGVVLGMLGMLQVDPSEATDATAVWKTGTLTS